MTASLAGFSAYNLGIALLQDGDAAHAIEQLDRAGQTRGARARRARDPRQVQPRARHHAVRIRRTSTGAQQSLDRVRLEGPFSNQALLRAGWAEASAEREDRALVPWNILVEREPTDAAVQEAMLAVPHAYATLKLYGRAALLYGRALETVQRRNRQGGCVDRQHPRGPLPQGADPRGDAPGPAPGSSACASLPEAPETYYLMELMASHDFQTALQNYLDLEDLRVEARFVADQPRCLRRHHPAARGRTTSRCCPASTREFRELDSRMRLRLEQRKRIATRLQAMLTAPRPDYLATADERIADGAHRPDRRSSSATPTMRRSLAPGNARPACAARSRGGWRPSTTRG